MYIPKNVLILGNDDSFQGSHVAMALPGTTGLANICTINSRTAIGVHKKAVYQNREFFAGLTSWHRPTKFVTCEAMVRISLASTLAHACMEAETGSGTLTGVMHGLVGEI